jgi:hypothetical protein
MATLLLAVGGAGVASGLGLTASAAAGSIAASMGVAGIGVVSTILGSIIDSYLFQPHSKHEGPRLNALQIQSSTEGSPIVEVFGKARVAGQLIWATNFREVSKVESSTVGGKGGAGTAVTTTTYEYYVSLAFALCRKITSLDRIWADGKLVVRKPRRIVESFAPTLVKFVSSSSAGSGGAYIELVTAEMRAGIPSVVVGAELSVTILEGERDNVGIYVITYIRFSQFHVKLGVTPDLTDARIVEDVFMGMRILHEIADLNPPSIYLGLDTQNPDSVITSVQGVGNTPAYRGVSYVVLEDIPLGRYGNRIPNFLFEVENG